MNSYDKELCRTVAELWKEAGGDADGMKYCCGYIIQILREMEGADG